TRSFRAGLYATVWGSTVEDLEVAAERFEIKAAGILLDLRPILFAPVQAWVTTRPLALDLVGRSWRMDAAPLARILPVSTGEAESDPAGALAGFHATSGVPYFFDRFRLGGQRTNFNKLTVAPTGRGKSYETKRELA